MEVESEELEPLADDEDQDQEGDYKVFPVHLVESYDALASASNSQNLTLVKGRYYKQTYRPAWEQMPDFKGWLRGVEGQPTRAFCTYCHKTLHAHRLSLLKHTCTIRHQKAAQLHANRKQADTVEENKDGQDEMLDDTPVEYAEVSNEVNEEESDQEDREADENDDSSQHVQVSKTYGAAQQKVDTDKSPISTHVTDMTRGKPIGGLQVSLYKLIDGRWTYINEGVTQPNGKFSQFIERSNFTIGRYKLHYDVDRYFEAKKQATMFPFIEIIFDSHMVSDCHHIPLVLSPFGYSTYKG